MILLWSVKVRAYQIQLWTCTSLPAPWESSNLPFKWVQAVLLENETRWGRCSSEAPDGLNQCVADMWCMKEPSRRTAIRKESKSLTLSYKLPPCTQDGVLVNAGLHTPQGSHQVLLPTDMAGIVLCACALYSVYTMMSSSSDTSVNVAIALSMTGNECQVKPPDFQVACHAIANWHCRLLFRKIRQLDWLRQASKVSRPLPNGISNWRLYDPHTGPGRDFSILYNSQISAVFCSVIPNIEKHVILLCSGRKFCTLVSKYS